MSGTPARPRAHIARRLQASVGALTKSTTDRMEREMPWFRDLSAEDRSWIAMIVQAGITSFVTWYRAPGRRRRRSRPRSSARHPAHSPAL